MATLRTGTIVIHSLEMELVVEVISCSRSGSMPWRWNSNLSDLVLEPRLAVLASAIS